MTQRRKTVLNDDTLYMAKRIELATNHFFKDEEELASIEFLRSAVKYLDSRPEIYNENKSVLDLLDSYVSILAARSK